MVDDSAAMEEFPIKIDNGYLFYENELQVIFEKKMIDKLLFAFNDHVEEHEEEIVVAIKGSNKFDDVKSDHDAELKTIEGWLETFFKHIDVGLKVATCMVKNLETEESMNEQDDNNQYSFVYESNIAFKYADIDSQEEATKLEEIASIKREAMLNTKNVNLQSRKEKLNHYLIARKVKMKLHQQMNKHGPFSKKTKMKCFVVSLRLRPGGMTIKSIVSCILCYGIFVI